MTTPHHLTPAAGPIRLEVTPESAGWTHLAQRIVALEPGGTHRWLAGDREAALIPLSGAMTVRAGGLEVPLERASVFTAMPTLVYVPPGTELTVTADTAAEFSLGSAPAEGRHPVRVVEPAEMRNEIRGGGGARRQVVHVLAPPLPAERLICYEVYVPRGSWSGWPPHCHDGRDGSPYLEETYLFRCDPPSGFALHRNWRDEESFDEVFAAADGDLVLVTRGYHSSAAAPGSHVWFLNYLAGELIDAERATPPCFHADHTWIVDDWDAGAWELPVVTAAG